MTERLIWVALRVLAAELPSPEISESTVKCLTKIPSEAHQECVVDVRDLITVIDATAITCVMSLDRQQEKSVLVLGSFSRGKSSYINALFAAARWPSDRWYRVAERLAAAAAAAEQGEDADEHATSALMAATAFCGAESSDINRDIALYGDDCWPEELTREASEVSNLAAQLSRTFLRYARTGSWRRLAALKDLPDIASTVLRVGAAERDVRAVLRGRADPGTSLIGSLLSTVNACGATNAACPTISSMAVPLEPAALISIIDFAQKCTISMTTTWLTLSFDARLVHAADLRLAERITTTIEHEPDLAMMGDAHELIGELKEFTNRSHRHGVSAASSEEFIDAFRILVRNHCYPEDSGNLHLAEQQLSQNGSSYDSPDDRDCGRQGERGKPWEAGGSILGRQWWWRPRSSSSSVT